VTQVTLYTYLPGGKLLGKTIFDNNVLAEQRDYVWMDDTPVAMHVTKMSPAAEQVYYLYAVPPGSYTFNPADISETTWRRKLLPADWGQFRVTLAPDPLTETFGRSGFFLHGGETPGSAGCIDVGSADRVLFPILKQLEGPVTIRVVK
jgi:hypothetical protein